MDADQPLGISFRQVHPTLSAVSQNYRCLDPLLHEIEFLIDFRYDKPRVSIFTIEGQKMSLGGRGGGHLRFEADLSFHRFDGIVLHGQF